MRLKLFIGLLGMTLPLFACADSPYIGTMSMLDMMITLVFGLCRVTGIVFIILSLVYFRRFRQNAVETPLSRVLWTFFFGSIVFLFPFLAQYSSVYQNMQQAAQLQQQEQQQQQQSANQQ